MTEKPGPSSRFLARLFARGGTARKPNSLSKSVAEVAQLWYAQLETAEKPALPPEEAKALVAAHVLPRFEGRRIGSVTRSEIQHIHDDLEDRPELADRVLHAAHGLFRFAELDDHRPPGTNPCIYVTPYRQRPQR